MIDKKFFSESAKTVAKKLLGKTICRKVGDGKYDHFTIIETEAYPYDEKCPKKYESTHLSHLDGVGLLFPYSCSETIETRGKNKRGQFNITCGKNGMENVLICATDCPAGYDENKYSSSGSLAFELGITKSVKGIDLTDNKGDLYIEDGEEINDKDIHICIRHGINPSNSDCQELLRFIALKKE